MARQISLHSKLSSILETLAKSAMAELCNAMDEDTVELRLELTRLQTLNSALKEKVDTLECELTAARNDVPRSRRTVAIQTGDDHESKSPVIEGVFGKDWCLNLWNDRCHTSDRMDDQSLDEDMGAPGHLHAFTSSSTPELEKGAEFYSLESFKEAIENWQLSNFVELYKRSSGTVENARKKSFNDNLVFAEVDFACAHVSKGSDLKHCPFTIKVRVTPDGRKLYIKDISPANCHNHEVSRAFLRAHESEHADGIQVKEEDYLEGTDANLAHKTLSQESDGRLFSEEPEPTPAWPMDVSTDGHRKGAFNHVNGTAPSPDGLVDDPDPDGVGNHDDPTSRADSSAAGQKYACSRCDIVFHNPGTLVTHQRAHLPYWCDACKEQFAAKAELKRHRCDDDPGKCHLCGKTWATLWALQTHMVVHTGEKPFVCRFCGQRFTQKGSMRTHLVRKHVGCGECGTTFDNKSQLLRHLLKHKKSAI
ncbi:uncharacterized protein LOC144087970 [Stigmatopora argus]